MSAYENPTASPGLPPLPARMTGRPPSHDISTGPIRDFDSYACWLAVDYMRRCVAARAAGEAPADLEPHERQPRIARAQAEAVAQLVQRLNAAIGDPQHFVTEQFLLTRGHPVSAEFATYCVLLCGELSGDARFAFNFTAEANWGASGLLARAYPLAAAYKVFPKLAAKFATLELATTRVTRTSARVQWRAGRQLERIPQAIRPHWLALTAEALKGALSALPRLHSGLPAADVRTLHSQAAGDPYDEWEFNWQQPGRRPDLWRWAGLAASTLLTGYVWLRLPGWEWLGPLAFVPALAGWLTTQARANAGERERLVRVLEKQQAEAEAQFDELQAMAARLQAANTSLEIELGEHRRMEATLRRHERQLALINNMTRAALATSSLNATRQILADSLASLLGGDQCYIAQWDEATGSVTGAAAGGTSNGNGEELLSGPEAAQLTASTLQAGRAVTLAAPAGAVLGLPLEAGDRKLGAALVLFAGSRAVAPEAMALGEQAGGQAALAIAKAELLQSERAARETAEILQAASMALTHTLDLDTVLASLLDYLGHLIPYDTANTMLMEGGSRLVVQTLRRQARLNRGSTLPGRKFEIQQFETFRTLVATKQSLLVSDTAAFPGWVRLPGTEHIRSWLGVPLVAGGHVIGIYSMNKSQPGFFNAAHARLAEAVAAQTAVAIQNARLFEQVRAGRERLKALSQRLVDTQEAERRHLAQELHDDVGQTLTGLKLLIESATRLPPEPAAGQLEAAAALVAEVMARVHDISLALRPAMLDDLGLRPALAWLFERYTAQTGVDVHPDLVGLDDRLQTKYETAIYRVVQEALTNVARHARTNQVWVRLLIEEEHIRLQIEDEGVGFDVNTTLAQNRRIGLIGMMERASLLGGHVRFGSQPGEGTWVSMVLPRTGRLERRGHDRFDPAG